jgi:hypothetical protein
MWYKMVLLETSTADKIGIVLGRIGMIMILGVTNAELMNGNNLPLRMSRRKMFRWRE